MKGKAGFLALALGIATAAEARTTITFRAGLKACLAAKAFICAFICICILAYCCAKNPAAPDRKGASIRWNNSTNTASRPNRGHQRGYQQANSLTSVMKVFAGFAAFCAVVAAARQNKRSFYCVRLWGMAADQPSNVKAVALEEVGISSTI